MGIEVAHGVGRQESLEDLRIGCCAIQNGDKTYDAGPRCIFCTRTQIKCALCLDDGEEGF